MVELILGSVIKAGAYTVYLEHRNVLAAFQINSKLDLLRNTRKKATINNNFKKIFNLI